MIKIKLTATEIELQKMCESMETHYKILHKSNITKNRGSKLARQYLDVEAPSTKEK